MLRITICLLVLLFSCHDALSQTNLGAKLEPDFGTSSDVYTLSLTLDGAGRRTLSDPIFEPSDTFEITQRGSTSRRQIINGKESFQAGLQLQVSIKKGLEPGQYLLPDGTVNIDGKRQKVPPLRLTIVETAKSESKADFRFKGVKITQYLDKKEAYVGEQITYTAEITHDTSFIGGNLEDYEPNGFWRERLGDKERNVFTIRGMTVNTFQEALIPTKSGVITIPRRTLRARIRAPGRAPAYNRSDPLLQRRFFERFTMLQRGYVNKNLATNEITVNIKPLPPTTLEGYIPVGLLDAKASINKSEIDANSSATVTVSIWGTANLRPYELKDPTDGTQGSKLYFDKPILTTGSKDGKIIFSKNFKIAVVPTRSGAIEVPSFKINYFDTETNEYRAISTTPLKLNVTGEVTNPLPSAPDKKEVQLIAEDLVAQHISSALYRNVWKLSQQTMFFLAALILALTIGARFYIHKYILPTRNPTLLKRQQARENALGKLKRDSSNLIDICDDSLRTYLSDKLASNTSSLTGDEIQRLLEESVSDQKLSQEVGQQVRLLEKMRFAESPEKEVDLKTLKLHTQTLIDKLETALETNI